MKTEFRTKLTQYAIGIGLLAFFSFMVFIQPDDETRDYKFYFEVFFGGCAVIVGAVVLRNYRIVRLNPEALLVSGWMRPKILYIRYEDIDGLTSKKFQVDDRNTNTQYVNKILCINLKNGESYAIDNWGIDDLPGFISSLNERIQQANP